MVYSTLGKSDLSISRIGFGCMSLDNAGDADFLIPKAVDMGINFFDTADLYQKGLNEEMVGKALSPFRNQVVLATKVGNQWRPDNSGWDWNPSKEYILKSVDQSLKRLRTDHIDLYQLHGGTIDDPIDETIDAFEILKASGKIRSYGISSIRPNVIREYVRRSNIVSVMMQYSLLDRRPSETIFQLLKENSIGVLTRGSVAGGLLLNKDAKAYLNYSAAEVQKVNRAIDQITDVKRSKADIAIQFALHHPSVTTAVIGIRTVQQLEEAIKAVQAQRLSANEIDMLVGSLPPNVYQDHR